MLGCAPSTTARQCAAGKYQGATKILVDGVDVWQIPVPSLPVYAQKRLAEEVKASWRARAEEIVPGCMDDTVRLSQDEYSDLWRAWERSGAIHKRRSEAALNALVAFTDLVDGGFSIGDAEKAIASSHGVSKPTLWRYRQAVKGHPRCNWTPLLMPRYKGGRPLAEFTEAAYEYILGKRHNTSKTPLAVVIEDARKLAPSKGWVIPSYDAVAARLPKEPKWLDTIGRDGPQALERSFPAVKKGYLTLVLHELWESDGRKHDVWCVWPDGSLARPFLIVWREVRSRLVLGAKGYLNPSAQGVLAAFGQAVQLAGTAPDYAKIDNGMEFAAKSVTGGQANRYRFDIVPGEQPGVMTKMGTKALWSPPRRGQDKPIESWWNYIAERVDMFPDFEGAYVGNGPQKKPENFAMANAIPIAVFEARLASVLEYFNTEHRHTGSGMDGRTPLEVYTELSKLKKRDPVDPAHLRLCKMGVAYLKPGKVDSVYTMKIPGYGVKRYWSEHIAGLTREVLSRKHAVYYDLENPTATIIVYDGYNELGEAKVIEDMPFIDHGGTRAGEHVKAKNAWMKPKKQALKAIKQAAVQDEVKALPSVTGLGELPPPMHSITVENNPAWKKSTAPQLVSAPLFTEEEEQKLAEGRRRAEEKKRLRNPLWYATTTDAT